MRNEMPKNGSSRNETTFDRICVKRRDVLLAGGATVLLTVAGFPQPLWASTVGYPRKMLARVSDLQADDPISIAYPDEESPCMLIKLDVPAGGGIGKDDDIVAFSTLCTHMGAVMDGTYSAKHKCLGPCPLHLTRFDLTRHGIIVVGHATESLPQILLEIEDDNIFGIGMIGLIYGRASNLG